MKLRELVIILTFILVLTSPFMVDVFAESGEEGELLLEQETEAIEEEPAEEIPDENIAAEVTDDAADGEEAPEQDVCTAGDSGLAPGNRVWFYNIAGGHSHEQRYDSYRVQRQVWVD